MVSEYKGMFQLSAARVTSYSGFGCSDVALVKSRLIFVVKKVARAFTESELRGAMLI